MGQYPNPLGVFKKIFKPVSNPFIKIKPRLIRGEAGQVPKKTRPIIIPSKWCVTNFRESCVLGALFLNNIVFKTQFCIIQDMSTISIKFFFFMHSGLRCYFIPKMPSPWLAQRPHQQPKKRPNSNT